MKIISCFSFTDPIPFDPCSRLKCGQGSACVLNINSKKSNKFVKCQCISSTDNCIESTHVCASDNVSYKSECHMDAAACASKKRLTIQHSGDCRSCKCVYSCTACMYY